MKHSVPDMLHIAGLLSANYGFVLAPIICSGQEQDRREPNMCVVYIPYLSKMLIVIIFFYFFLQFEEYGRWSHVSFPYRLKISQWHRQTHRKTKIQLDIATNKLSQQKGWLNKEEKVI